MLYDLVIFPNGTASLKPKDATEPMHSSIGAWTEAQSLYVGPSRLQERLTHGSTAPLIVYDVGMGIAANALAALQCALNIPSSTRRGLHVVSFENDLNGLRTALENFSRFPFFAGFETALTELIKNGKWENAQAQVKWELREGDFLKQPLGEPAPEVIFYDFYSPKSSEENIWGYRNFARLRAACVNTTLITYSSATAVRAAMLLGGFFVGTGPATSIKRETTIASTHLSALKSPLDVTWLEKFKRSSKRLPPDWPTERSDEAIRMILGHPQFL
jgi:queuine tRNA-ribosyltransferase